MYMHDYVHHMESWPVGSARRGRDHRMGRMVRRVIVYELKGGFFEAVAVSEISFKKPQSGATQENKFMSKMRSNT
jgi:hypothetical protein